MSLPVLAHLHRRSVERSIKARGIEVELSSRESGRWPTVKVALLDESARGIRVGSSRTLSIGEMVIVRIGDRPEEPARVIWSGDGEGGPELGLEFIGRSTIAAANNDDCEIEEGALDEVRDAPSGRFPRLPRQALGRDSRT